MIKTEENDFDHVLEVEKVEDVNRIIREGRYRLDRFSETRNVYILILRTRRERR